MPVFDAFFAVFYQGFEYLQGQFLVAVLFETFYVLKLLALEFLVYELFEAVGALPMAAGIVEDLALGDLLLGLYLNLDLALLALQFIEDSVDILALARLVALRIALTDRLLAPAHIRGEIAHLVEKLIIVDQFLVDLCDVLLIDLRGNQIATLFITGQLLESYFF